MNKEIAAGYEPAANQSNADGSVDTKNDAVEQFLTALLPYARTDAYAQRQWQEKEESYGYVRIAKPLNTDVIRRHLTTDGPQVAAYVMPPGEKTRFAALDFDDHDEAEPYGWSKVQKAVRKVSDTLRDWGFEPYIELVPHCWTAWQRS